MSRLWGSQELPRGGLTWGCCPQALNAARVTARLRSLEAPRARGGGLAELLPALRAVTALRCAGADLPASALRRLGHLAGNLVELDARGLGPVHTPLLPAERNPGC